MQTSTVFNFLSENNLLVPFLHENKVLEELTKEDLLVVVEKLLNPTYVTQPQVEVVEEQQQVVEEPQQEPVLQPQALVVVNNEYRQKTIKLSLQEMYDRLVNDGLVSTGNYGKNLINSVAVDLGMMDKQTSYHYGHKQSRYFPTEYGISIGLKKRNHYAVWYSLESYDIIKDVLLGSVRK